MTFRKMILLIAALFAVTTQAYAYTIYNKLPHSVQVKDKSGFGGIDVTMPANSSAACSPKARGCHGKIEFKVYATQAKDKVVCTWQGKIDDTAGNYFVISPVPGVNYPAAGACNVEYYRS